jgi:hypothetical protein
MAAFTRKMIPIAAFNLPVDIERSKGGFVFVTSPIVPGLLITEDTEEEALRQVPDVLAELAQATLPGDPVPSAQRGSPGTNPKDP